MGFLTIKDVTYGFGKNNPVLRKVNWDIQEGEFHCLLGKSGSGKTTLLKLAAGLLPNYQGTILLHGSKVVEPTPQCGFVFQSPTLLEWKNVLDNVLLPISLKRKVTIDDKGQALALLKMVGLAAYAERYPLELSGGQQSRVAIARSLMQKPTFLLMDEPFAALDAITREELQDDLLRLCERNRMTVLFITHDIAEAVYLGDVVGVMENGEIVNRTAVELERPRSLNMRYQSYFNELCLQLRQVMSGGQS